MNCWTPCRWSALPGGRMGGAGSGSTAPTGIWTGVQDHPCLLRVWRCWRPWASISLAMPSPWGGAVNWPLSQRSWCGSAAAALQRGWLWCLDYGHSAQRYYNPQRLDGTLMAYTQQRAVGNPFLQPGQMDLTAHICTDLLRHWAEEAGWEWCGEVSQGQGLLALGLAQHLSRLWPGWWSPFGPAAHPAGGVAAAGGSRWAGGIPLVAVPPELLDASAWRTAGLGRASIINFSVLLTPVPDKVKRFRVRTHH